MQMTVTLHLQVVIISNTATLHILVQVAPEHLKDIAIAIAIAMIGVNTIVNSALHLEVVTTDGRDINKKLIALIIVM